MGAGLLARRDPDFFTPPHNNQGGSRSFYWEFEMLQITIHHLGTRHIHLSFIAILFHTDLCL